MPVIYYSPDDNAGDKVIELEEDESVLDALLRSDIDVPFGCKSGVCQSCLMQSPDSIPNTAKQGLKQTQIEQGLFLACSCAPKDDLRVHPGNVSSQRLNAKVLAKRKLDNNIILLRVENVTSYRAGQFMTLWNENRVARSYSTASVPLKDEFIEFHIKRIENGAFSDWAWDNLNEGDSIQIQGPLGECFYTKTEFSQDMMLSGIGTGLAPLFGIARDALNQGHSGNIKMIIGGRRSSGFYLIEELLELQETFRNFDVTFVAEDIDNSEVPEGATIIKGDIYKEVNTMIPSFKNMKVFLCGAETFVRKMKKQCFLGGANMKEIMSDPFIAFGKT